MVHKFITEFHNLPGTTVKQKHKNLFSLLRHQSYSPQELDDIVANLEPTTHLEKIFYVDVLIYFQRTNELYKQYLNGDDNTISKVSKHGWFYQKAFQKIIPEDFVKTFLPTLSYSLKAKLLKKLPLDEKLADDVFTAVQKKYGTFLATIILQKCTTEKIHETLINNAVKLTYKQLQAIHKKNPNLIYVYIEERTKNEGGSKFLHQNSFLTYIAQKDPEMFADLLNKYKFEGMLGRRTTKRYIELQENHILGKLETYFKILNTSIFVRKFGAELQHIFFKKNEETDELLWVDLLKHYPRNRQFSIYKTMHNLTYNQKFGENVDAIPEDILKIIPDQTERERIAQLKLAKEENQNYLKYVTPENCLQEFMEKVNHIDVSERAKYIEIITECCILNKDLGNLLKVLQLLCGRFKNDDTKIRDSFFYLIGGNKILDTFTEQHWDKLLEVISISNARDDWVHKECRLRMHHLKFMLKEKKDCVMDVILKCKRWAELIYYGGPMNENPTIYNMVLKELVKIGFPKPNITEKYSARYDCVLAHLCKIYNKRYPENIVNIYGHPRILKSVKYMLENEVSCYDNNNCDSGIQYMICCPNLPKEFMELRQLYFKAFKHFGRLSGVVWFLQNEPNVLKDNLKFFLDQFNAVGHLTAEPIWRCMKKYSHLDMDKIAVEFLKSKLAAEGCKDKAKLIKALLILLTPDSYLEYIKTYLPVSTETDLTDENTRNLYAIQTQLIKCMHHIHSPAKVLPVVLELCNGHYLRYALRPLYSCFHNLPENETKPFIEKLKQNKAISVKKHGMTLTILLCDVDTVYNCLKEADVFALMATLKYFVKNPSDMVWQLVETKIRNIETKNLQVLKSAIHVNVPSKYKGQYVETIWKILIKYEDEGIKKSLITKMDKGSIENLNPEFAFHIIRAYIFTSGEANDFVANILINLNNNDKFDLFANILEKFKNNCWSGAEGRNARKILNNFILCLFAKYVETEEVDKKFTEKLSAIFKLVFSMSEAFEESILISCLGFKGDTVENNGKLLIHLNHCAEKEYGPYATYLFAGIIKTKVFAYIWTTRREQIKLCYSLFKLRESVSDNLLLLMLLPENQPEDTEHFSLYNEILTDLRLVIDNVVKLQLNLHLKSGSEGNNKVNCDSCSVLSDE
ncbi:uncharacterized protein LOC135132458 [Zophobas morio]|uniref:uncharacterized protein LOC135132458 n=1 Tax=Zophobas morio TaxID=2755281 RepID=UPI0030827561